MTSFLILFFIYICKYIYIFFEYVKPFFFFIYIYLRLKISFIKYSFIYFNLFLNAIIFSHLYLFSFFFKLLMFQILHQAKFFIYCSKMLHLMIFKIKKCFYSHSLQSKNVSILINYYFKNQNYHSLYFFIKIRIILFLTIVSVYFFNHFSLKYRLLTYCTIFL